MVTCHKHLTLHNVQFELQVQADSAPRHLSCDSPAVETLRPPHVRLLKLRLTSPLLSSPYTHRWLFLFVCLSYFHLPRALPVLGKNCATDLTHQGFRVKITLVGGRKRKQMRREKKADGPTGSEDKDGKASFSFFFFFFSSLCSWMDMLLLLGGGQAAQRQVDGQ